MYGYHTAVQRRFSLLRCAVSSRSALRWVAPATCPLLTGCGQGVLDPAGPVAAGERLLLFNSLAIMLAIVVPVIVLTLAFAWWFRAGNTRARHLPDWSYSGRLELLVWSIPALVIIFLGGLAWIASHDLDPARPIPGRTRPIEVEVVALDWKWLFIYPDQGIASINRLAIPVGTPVHFRITSATVMNSFFVPQLGSQIYAMSGMEAQLNLRADRIGRFHGISAHYSGKGFADMTFAVDAMPPAQFANWVAGTRAAGRTLDARAYLQLARVHASAAPVTFGQVQPHLFEAAIRQAGTATAKTAQDGREDR